jgi:hypothetical protein
MAVAWTSAPRNSPMPLAGPCLLDAMSVETREGLELPRSAGKHTGRRSVTQRIFLRTESSATTKRRHRCLPGEFDDAFDDMDIPEDFPGDIAASPDGLKCIKKFLAADMALKREACPSCRESDWDMRIREGKCHRCRRDNGHSKLQQ